VSFPELYPPKGTRCAWCGAVPVRCAGGKWLCYDCYLDLRWEHEDRHVARDDEHEPPEEE
jgi:hypothetical protein